MGSLKVVIHLDLYVYFLCDYYFMLEHLYKYFDFLSLLNHP